jgi:crotonobetainyl-CoA:carnitine CoA-transferase CaiB-like acyl-CoA transferase
MATASHDNLLSGIRILDLTSMVMGPYATSMLAEFGADVVKVESPRGDPIRGYPGRHPGMSGMFLNLNRNKRSIVLDLASDAGKRALLRLVSNADVFVHTLRPKTAAALGVDYGSISARKSDVVYCGAYGFGAAGPYRDKAAYDDVIQAASGFAALGREVPAYVPSVVMDKLAGQTLANSVLAAIVRRLRTGQGANVEVPMFETAIAFNFLEHWGPACFDPPVGPIGFPRLLAKQRKPYKTRDGYVCIMPYSDENWSALFRYADRDELVEDPRFLTLGGRTEHIEELYGLLASLAATRTNAEWIEFCHQHDISCMPVLHLEEIEADAHVRAVGLFRQAEHPTEGAYRYIRNPVTVEGCCADLRYHAPSLGQHTREILREAGLGEAENATQLTQEPR